LLGNERGSRLTATFFIRHCIAFIVYKSFNIQKAMSDLHFDHKEEDIIATMNDLQCSRNSAIAFLDWCAEENNKRIFAAEREDDEY